MYLYRSVRIARLFSLDPPYQSAAEKTSLRR